MPVYDIDLSDGRTVTVESDTDPTEEQVLGALQSFQEPEAPSFAPSLPQEEIVQKYFGAPPAAPAQAPPPLFDESMRQVPMRTTTGTTPTPMMAYDLPPEERRAQFKEDILTPAVPLPRLTIDPKESPVTAAGKEAVNVLIGVPEFVETPAGILSFGAAAIAPILTAGGFTADMLYNLGKQIKTAYGNWDKMTPAEKTVAVVDMAGTGAFAALTGTAAGRGIQRRLEPPQMKATRELAKVLETTEPMGTVQPRQPIRQLGIPQAALTAEPFLQPGIPELAGQALREAQSPLTVPGRTPAIEMLRSELAPPEVVPVETRLAGRIPERGGTMVTPTLEGVQVQPRVLRSASDILLERFVGREPMAPEPLPIPPEVQAAGKKAEAPVAPAKAPPAKPAEAPKVEPEIARGDTILWRPKNAREARVQGDVQGVVVEVIRNPDGDIGYEILAPLEGDPGRVLRVWAERGNVEVKARAPVEEKPPQVQPSGVGETGTVQRRKSVVEIADEIAKQGVDPQASYGLFVKERQLKPEIDAKEWLPIYKNSLELEKLRKQIEVTKRFSQQPTPSAKVEAPPAEPPGAPREMRPSPYWLEDVTAPSVETVRAQRALEQRQAEAEAPTPIEEPTAPAPKPPPARQLKPEVKKAILFAEEKSANALAEGNKFAEKGDDVKAEEFYDKSAKWLMRANELRENPSNYTTISEPTPKPSKQRTEAERSADEVRFINRFAKQYAKRWGLKVDETQPVFISNYETHHVALNLSKLEAKDHGLIERIRAAWGKYEPDAGMGGRGYVTHSRILNELEGVPPKEYGEQLKHEWLSTPNRDTIKFTVNRQGHDASIKFTTPKPDLISKLESLKLPETGEGNLYSLPHPDAIKAIGRSTWNTAIDVAIASVKAGKAIAQAVEDAIAYLRKNVKGLDEAQARANLEYVAREETRPAAAPTPERAETPAAAIESTEATRPVVDPITGEPGKVITEAAAKRMEAKVKLPAQVDVEKLATQIDLFNKEIGDALETGGQFLPKEMRPEVAKGAPAERKTVTNKEINQYFVNKLSSIRKQMQATKQRIAQQADVESQVYFDTLQKRFETAFRQVQELRRASHEALYFWNKIRAEYQDIARAAGAMPEMKRQLPILDQVWKDVREGDYRQGGRHFIDFLRMNLFTLGSWTLDFGTNLVATATKLPSWAIMDAASFVSGNPATRMMSATRALADNMKNWIPFGRRFRLPDQIESELGTTAGGEFGGKGREVIVDFSEILRTKPELADKLRHLDKLLGAPVRMKRAVDSFFGRFGATAELSASQFGDGFRGHVRHDEFHRRMNLDLQRTQAGSADVQLLILRTGDLALVQPFQLSFDGGGRRHGEPGSEIALTVEGTRHAG